MMIYDCFSFFNELEVLEIRLNELYKVVDRFVIVEATRTHQGKEKPLYFQLNKERFKKFQDKIIHIIVEDLYPEERLIFGHYDFFSQYVRKEKSQWTNERKQRDAILRGLTACSDNDIILISDADEIPNPEKILEFKEYPGVKIFKQDLFYYYLNYKADIPWFGTVMLSNRDLKKFLEPTILRRNIPLLVSNKFFDKIKLVIKGLLISIILQKIPMNLLIPPKVTIIENGGWHFSWLGGIDRIIQKIEAYAHKEVNTPNFKDTNLLKKNLENMRFFNSELTIRKVTIDASYPKTILDNIEKYLHLIKQ